MRASRLIPLQCGCALAGALLSAATGAAVPLAPVSPADPTGRCPTFEWRDAGAPVVEIEVYRVSGDEDAGLDAPVLQVTVEGTGTRWSAAGAQCLEPGQHAWSVRALPDGVWSDPALFVVDGVPSDAELEAAVEVIERYLAQRGAADTDPQARPPIAAKGGSEITAVQGMVPDGAGVTRGVHGVVASPAGAGVLAENTHPGGFDLQLAGPVPASVSEREWRLDSPTPQSIDFTNPSGSLSVRVQGQPLITTATDQDTTYSAGNQLALAGTRFDVVEGSGSGLDADTLDGLSASAFAGGVHDHFGQYWTGTGTFGLLVDNPNGIGVDGLSRAGTGSSPAGVRGQSIFATGVGVLGVGQSASGFNRGVEGWSNSPQGAGAMFGNFGGGALLAAGNTNPLSLATARFVVGYSGDVFAKSFHGDGRPLTGIEPSLFRTFGGDGSDGALVAGVATEVTGRRQYTTLTVPQGSLLSVPVNTDGRALLAVQGRCSIAGIIRGFARGAPGGPSGSTSTFPGQPGTNAFRASSRTALPNCVSGAGGGGGGAVDVPGGSGGGAEGDGGQSGQSGAAGDRWKRAGISGGGTGNRDGQTSHASFANILACPGAGGGAGATYDDDGANSGGGGGGGGAGGAVIYLECGELDLAASGVIDARGNIGGPGTCSGSDCSVRDGSGGAGGGGGGVILIRTRSIISQQGQLLVSGGAGGQGAGFAGLAGGAGADGYADILVVD